MEDFEIEIDPEEIDEELEWDDLSLIDKIKIRTACFIVDCYYYIVLNSMCLYTLLEWIVMFGSEEMYVVEHGSEEFGTEDKIYMYLPKM